MGIERAFKRETGESLEDLGDEWKEAMQVKYLPQVAQLQRPRHFAKPLLSQKSTGGQVFLAPALSPDGKYIAFLSNGSFIKGQVFIDLWLGDAEDRQADHAAGEEHLRSELPGDRDSLLPELLLAGREAPRVHRAGRRTGKCCICST